MSVPTSLSFFHNDLWAPPFFREKSIIHHCTSPLFWCLLSHSHLLSKSISLFVSPARGSFSQSPLDGWSFFLWRVQSSRHYRLPFHPRACFIDFSLARALPVFLCVPYFLLAVRVPLRARRPNMASFVFDFDVLIFVNKVVGFLITFLLLYIFYYYVSRRTGWVSKNLVCWWVYFVIIIGSLAFK